MSTQDEQDVSCTWQNLQRCHGKLCLGRKEVVERVHARESGKRERERELYDYFRQFHWPTKQSWADELALFNFNWSQLAETLVSNGTMQYNPMSNTLSLNPYCFLSNCIYVVHYRWLQCLMVFSEEQNIWALDLSNLCIKRQIYHVIMR